MERRQRQEVLRPSDVVVLLRAHLLESEGGWTFSGLGSALGVSSSRVHDSIRRCQRATLVAGGRRVLVRNLLEFLVHGVRYAFPVAVGQSGFGVPTGAFAAPLKELLLAAGDPYVWPAIGEGTVKGQTVTPLHPNVPDIARRDERMHQLLALVDGLRIGGSRERGVAAKALAARLEAGDDRS